MRVIGMALCIAGLLLACIFGLLMAVALSDARYVCPDGNQCSDVVTTALFAGTLMLAFLVAAFFGFRRLRASR
jgi:hypothetical protein